MGYSFESTFPNVFETERDLHSTIEATPSLLDSIGVTS
ncbi:hypothetical protein APHNP_0757 [Anaplasma phagocytophilum str. ApNP]|uniref:Uncharacterized protein n=1 Tax=Anaplasma phagocytophilum str. ApNP TaxID=1359153 RepID=A0A0F3NF22_ANAPH|nr:hypothetical protein APHNP_0757 [Anaplasma phagocytophilum str. ApNP]